MQSRLLQLQQFRVRQFQYIFDTCRKPPQALVRLFKKRLLQREMPLGQCLVSNIRPILSKNGVITL